MKVYGGKMIGVVADDFTGANDIGIMFAKNGYKVLVYSEYANPAMLEADSDVIILNTNSRLDDPSLAYRKVREATAILKAIGCTVFHKKTCSVFRGNIGAEFDAMLDELGEEFCAVILGFPKNGRVTKDGIHYVRGMRLEESEFRNDPMHPMVESDLTKILGKQTERKVGLIPHTVISQGLDKTRSAMEAAKKNFNYLIFDVLDQQMLNVVAGAVTDVKALAGSSAIGEELPKWLPIKGKGVSTGTEELRNPKLGTLIIAGSVTPQTRRQVEYAKARGVRYFTLLTEKLLNSAEGTAQLADCATLATEAILAGESFLVHSENEPEQVAASKAKGIAAGYEERELGRMISLTLSGIADEVIRSTGLTRLIVLGGETSGAVCEKLGIIGNMLLKEITPGVPSVLTLGRTSLLMAPKSGSFGDDDFIITAEEHLKGL
jgi:uncharacterized protein YgbK (DUF1537 family)